LLILKGSPMSINSAYCPECDHHLKLGTRPYKGQKVICSSCDTNLTLTNLRPLELESTGSPQQGGRKKNNSIELACPECEALIRVNPRAREGQQVICPDCETLLEVVSSDPIELDVALMIDIDIKHTRRQKGRR